jgi:hypothetical protein
MSWSVEDSMPTERVMSRTKIARAFHERPNYVIFEEGGHEDAGRDVRFYAVHHRRKRESQYTLYLVLDVTLRRFVPDGCNCWDASKHPGEYCKHAIMFMADSGLLSEDIHAEFDPAYIAQQAKKRKAA